MFTNAPTGLLFPGDKPVVPKGANFTDRNDWGARVGFAWDPKSNGKTSSRGDGSRGWGANQRGRIHEREEPSAAWPPVWVILTGNTGDRARGISEG